MLESLRKNESFTYTKLSPEEMKSRGILGRLVGPCADFTIPTRNGRKYEESLWDRVFDDEIVNEKIKNKCLFGELGHPLDREEVDPEKIAIALNEVPKKNDKGQLIACFDILNTPCGKILKSLCDYGTTIGISSRGSGDLITEANGDEVVDPETYYFECFDAVLLPAVKSARLKYMTESMDTNAIKLKKALKESYDSASVEDQKIMKETLDDLNIKLDEANINIDDIPWAAEEEPLNEEVADVAEEAVVEDKEEASEEHAEADEVDGIDYADEADVPVSETNTVGDLMKEIEDYDEDLPIEFAPIVIDDKEYQIKMLGFNDDEKDKLIISIGYEVAGDDNIDNVAEDDEEVSDASDEEPLVKKDEAEEEAVDDGTAEVFENLKEAIRQKDLLEQEVKNLKNERTVRDTEVKALEENLTKYKAAFVRTSEVAAKATKLEASNKQLQEQVTKQQNELNKLNKVHSEKLNESVNESKKQIISLKEQLNAAKSDLEQAQENANKQASIYKKKISESVDIANRYKTMCNEIMNKFISYRASLLGVKPAEILNKLDEQYSFEDVEKACDSILNEGMVRNKLPYEFAKKPVVKFAEPKAQTASYKSGYEIDDSLLDLAGLK